MRPCWSRGLRLVITSRIVAVDPSWRYGAPIQQLRLLLHHRLVYQHLCSARHCSYAVLQYQHAAETKCQVSSLGPTFRVVWRAR